LQLRAVPGFFPLSVKWSAQCSDKNRVNVKKVRTNTLRVAGVASCSPLLSASRNPLMVQTFYLLHPHGFLAGGSWPPPSWLVGPSMQSCWMQAYQSPLLSARSSLYLWANRQSSNATWELSSVTARVICRLCQAGYYSEKAGWVYMQMRRCKK
jgi:hypothetical protein